jgi:Asp-tRNA(Asn)/Glu-tRNA(Gln) amidotransferase A subunit family amidase
MDQVSVVGPITRTVRDNAMMLNVVAGPDPFEMFALQETGVDYLAALEGASVAGLRVAYSPDLGAPPVEPEVRDIVRQAASAFAADLGAHVDEVALHLPDVFDYFIGWWGPQEAMMYEDLEASGAVADPSRRARLDQAYAMTAVDYARVQFELREVLHRAFAEVFLDHDLLVWPTTPMAAYPHPGDARGPTTVDGQQVRWPGL